MFNEMLIISKSEALRNFLKKWEIKRSSVITTYRIKLQHWVFFYHVLFEVYQSFEKNFVIMKNAIILWKIKLILFPVKLSVSHLFYLVLIKWLPTLTCFLMKSQEIFLRFRCFQVLISYIFSLKTFAYLRKFSQHFWFFFCNMRFCV